MRGPPLLTTLHLDYLVQSIELRQARLPPCMRLGGLNAPLHLLQDRHRMIRGPALMLPPLLVTPLMVSFIQMANNDAAKLT